MTEDIRTLSKWLNEESTAPIDRQALARVLSLVQQEQWLPIESAPKDGTAVIVAPGIWKGRDCSTATYNDDRYAKKPRPYWDRDDALGQVLRSRETPPTHWQPLPTAPKAIEDHP